MPEDPNTSPDPQINPEPQFQPAQPLQPKATPPPAEIPSQPQQPIQSSPPAPFAGISQQQTPQNPNVVSSGVGFGGNGLLNGSNFAPGVRAVSGRKSGFSLLIIAIVFIGIGALVFKTSQIPKTYARTTGKIVSQQFVASASRNTGSSYYPEIQFSVNHNTYNFEGSTGSNPPSFTIGENVTVAYNPSDPGKSPKDASAKSPAFIAGVFILFGIIALIFAIIVFVK